jgi:HAD superfamily hydrolase (TIGR01450 family)
MLSPSRVAGSGGGLDGLRALILDADGVIVLKGAPLPGAPEALRRLDERGIPFRIVTNFSSAHRETLAARFGTDTFRFDPDRIVTAASAAAAHAAAQHAGQPIFVLAAPDALREFEGQVLLTPDEAAAPGARAAAVVIGDGGDDLSYRNLDSAFRLVRDGAEFLAMHRNPWWLTPRGVTLDAGAAVAGLEYSLGQRALVLGKPSPAVFRQALAGLAAEIAATGGPRLTARAVAMVGDDLRSDLAPARRLGMGTVLVLTGKVTPDGIEPAIADARHVPDLVAPSLAGFVAALD